MYSKLVICRRTCTSVHGLCGSIKKNQPPVVRVICLDNLFLNMCSHTRAQSRLSLKVSISVVSNILKYCVMNPNAETGVPAISEMVEKLRRVSADGADRLFRVALTATDFMSVVISAPCKDGKQGPKVSFLIIYPNMIRILDARESNILLTWFGQQFDKMTIISVFSEVGVGEGVPSPSLSPTPSLPPASYRGLRLSTHPNLYAN